jgi:hypothetical protein
MESRNLDTIRRLFAAVEARDPEALLACYHEDVVIREAESLPYGGTYRGHDGALRHGLAYLRCWGTLQGDEQRKLDHKLLDAGEFVVVQWRQKARNPESGETLDAPAVSLYRMRRGRIAESTMYHFDTARLLAFLQDTLSLGRDSD